MTFDETNSLNLKAGGSFLDKNQTHPYFLYVEPNFFSSNSLSADNLFDCKIQVS